jgi:hypothetical protein
LPAAKLAGVTVVVAFTQTALLEAENALLGIGLIVTAALAVGDTQPFELVTLKVTTSVPEAAQLICTGPALVVGGKEEQLPQPQL